MGLVALHHPRPEHWDKMISRVPKRRRSWRRHRVARRRLLDKRRSSGRGHDRPVRVETGDDGRAYGRADGPRRDFDLRQARVPAPRGLHARLMQMRAIPAHSALICATQLMIALKPPTVQNSGAVRAAQVLCRLRALNEPCLGGFSGLGHCSARRTPPRPRLRPGE